MQKRLSPTLLDSFAYYLSVENAETSAVKRQELLDRLNGIKTPPSKAMLAGIAFEDAVWAACNGKYVPKDDAYDKCVNEIADIVRGGIYQHKVAVQIGDVVMDGIIDFLKANRIYDIKTTKSYEIGKHYESNQHLVYLLAMQPEKIETFTYLATDFRHTFKEEYHYNGKVEDAIKANIACFMDYLTNDPQMNQAYQNYCERKETYALQS